MADINIIGAMSSQILQVDPEVDILLVSLRVRNFLVGLEARILQVDQGVAYIMAIGMEAHIPITKAIIHTFEFTHTPGPNLGTYFHLDF